MRFSEKRHRQKNLMAAIGTLESKIEPLIMRRKLNCQLREEIKQTSERISYVRCLMAEKRDNLSRLQALKKELHESNRLLRMKLPRCDVKVKTMGGYVSAKLEESERRRAQLTELQEKLKQLKRDSVEKLVKYIFPISRAISNKSSLSSSDGETKNTIIEISEASRTAYVRGKWILQDSFGEVQHIIVAPTLPGNGNYSMYHDWGIMRAASDANFNGKSGDDAIKLVGSRNPAHIIAAALTYTTQLVQIISFYLDVRTPYKLSYSDFCTTALSETQFNRKVARLNANILYLCYTQGCRLGEARPTQTLKNILRLLNPSQSDLGRFGPTDRNFCLNELAESVLTQHLGGGGDDSDSDDELNIRQEWESIPSNLPQASETNAMLLAGPGSGGGYIAYGNTYHYHQPQHQVTTTSLVTSAVASVTSFWKGWTGK
ncbi:beclin 1-associated autophagy-related key regulator isoform X2 [Toxorhynchites rutilus septentrionalis]|uniref:beclin 1-associated autophagy-related key regulator isoform X2 n=1 Tax=Toxorhynchites rutilus septentrionalis TaxID=329112 RepID=UPI00247A3A10|nr:beclin 1-associated autophagy-related key regulator isoform X2 [Toxorhynchites rutilus septentrionalis]XP_055620297.1 beclin 1-associated autophagy-related key regulator isoform X2 [Toxorhynchites rutilus septentrionalis]